MENKGKSVADGKDQKVENLHVEEMERRVAPVVSSLDPDGDGILTGRLQPRTR